MARSRSLLALPLLLAACRPAAGVRAAAVPAANRAAARAEEPPEAPPAAPEASPEPGFRCTSSEHLTRPQVEARYGELARSLAALPLGGDTRPWLRQLRAALDSACGAPRPLPPQLEVEGPVSRLSLEAWLDEGGKDTVKQGLSGPGHDLAQLLFSPPLRHAYALETGRADPLAPLLCPAADAGCGAEAEAYRADIDERFASLAASEARWAEVPLPAMADKVCEARAREKPPGLQRAEFDRCIRAVTVPSDALPLGHFRAPSGWLLLRGRRGHYAFCDELRAYHLASGSVYVARRCGGLVLGGKAVDEAATGRGSKGVVVGTGVMLPQALRRVALLLALRDRVDHDVDTRNMAFSIPETIHEPPPWGLPELEHRTWGTSAQTGLTYRLFEKGQRLVAGELTWPNSSSSVEEVADQLLVAAEQSFAPGCPPAPLPASLDLRGEQGYVSPLDASAGSLRRVGDELAEALEARRSKPAAGCR